MSSSNGNPHLTPQHAWEVVLTTAITINVIAPDKIAAEIAAAQQMYSMVPAGASIKAVRTQEARLIGPD